MTDVERTEEQPEVEGHVAPEGEDRMSHSPERLNQGPERQPHGRTGHGRTGHPNSEEEGSEVEGHVFARGPERGAHGPERLSS